VLLRTRGALEAKVARSLADVSKQLFERQDISYLHHSLSPLAALKPHHCTRAWETTTETDT